MTHRRRICRSLLLCLFMIPQARALLNFNEGKDLVFVSATYSVGLDTNVFTRTRSTSAYTQTLSASVDYSRQAGLISVSANLSATSGSFSGIRGQDFFDPTLGVSFRKRYGRTTGALNFSARHESQPDPDVGQRTQSSNYSSGLDVRYPVNDRYYFTNNLRGSAKVYSGSGAFSDLYTYSEAIALNYIYTSKLDLNGGYTISISDTSRNTKAYDQSLTLGASGGILPKLSGSIRAGLQRRDSDSTVGGSEQFYAFTSGTSLKWLFSRRLTFNAELNEDFSTTATDISVNRATAGLHGTVSLSSKYIGNGGVTYSVSDFLGKAGLGRKDEMLQLDASIGVALTTHIRTSLSYTYMINWSNAADADFERQMLSFTVIATY